MTPTEALQKTVAYFVVCTGINIPNKPGAVVSRMDHETREALKKLTADDFKHMVGPDWYDAK